MPTFIWMQPSTFTHLTFLMPLQIYSLHSNQIAAFLKVSLPFYSVLLLFLKSKLKWFLLIFLSSLLKNFKIKEFLFLFLKFRLKLLLFSLRFLDFFIFLVFFDQITFSFHVILKVLLVSQFWRYIFIFGVRMCIVMTIFVGLSLFGGEIELIDVLHTVKFE